MAEWDNTTRETVKKIPFLTEKSGPRDKDKWQDRLKQVCGCASGLEAARSPCVHASSMLAHSSAQPPYALRIIAARLRSCTLSSPTSR